jgi:choline dehydrogenase-like flavoprotein
VTDTFDFVVVGAGSGGCAVAGRLSEDPNTSVALLDAGGKNHNWARSS